MRPLMCACACVEEEEEEDDEEEEGRATMHLSDAAPMAVIYRHLLQHVVPITTWTGTYKPSFSPLTLFNNCRPTKTTPLIFLFRLSSR